VPARLRVRSADHPSFLFDSARSPWKILLETISLRPEVTSEETMRMGLRVQTLGLFTEILPPWLRADVNASFVFGPRRENGINRHEINLIGGSHFYMGSDFWRGGERGIVSLLPAYFRFHLGGTLASTQSWTRQEISGFLSFSFFFPRTPLDLVGLNPGGPRALHESFWSLSLSYGAAALSRPDGGDDDSYTFFHLDLHWAQPLPIEFSEIVGLVIGNDGEDAQRARKRWKRGDELDFPVLTIRWKAWWGAEPESPLRFSRRNRFHSYVELEVRVPMGWGFYALFSYADGRMPLWERSTSEFRTGIELSL
jgi:hypothetical protein